MIRVLPSLNLSLTLILEKKSSSLLFFSLIAISLHLVAIFFLIKYYKPLKKQENKTSVEIIINNQPQVTQKKSVQIKSSHQEKNIKKKKKKKSIKNFLPKNLNWAAQLTKKETIDKDKVFSNNIKDSNFDLLIWEKIDKVLYYPEIFTFFLLEGNIEAEISIKPDGTLKNLPYIKAKNNKHLEKFILSRLNKAFNIKLEKNNHSISKKTHNYKVNFRFYISYQPDEVITNHFMKLENKTLNFYRKSFNYKKSPVDKALPFFMGGGNMINYVRIFNKLSGNEKAILIKNKKKLEEFYLKNSGH